MIQNMIKKNQIQSYVDLGSRNRHSIRYKTEDNSQNHSSSVTNCIEVNDNKDEA
jgi:hypothetical protein